jgi:hypothetical protein
METTTMRQPPHHVLAPLSVPIPPLFNALRIPANMMNQYQRKEIWKGRALIQCFSDSATASTSSPSSPPPENAPPVLRRRKRYRRQYPGESKGITEEMRFVAMRLRKADKSSNDDDDQDSFSEDDKEEEGNDDVGGGGGGGGGVTWQPIMDGFLKYLVDSKLVFNTVERIVDESSHVACEYS